jgi:hypothetical protein
VKLVSAGELTRPSKGDSIADPHPQNGAPTLRLLPTSNTPAFEHI